jgi:transposase
MTMTNASLVARAQNGKVRDDDPAPKPTRRRFSTEYKRAILEQYDRLTEPGSKGALLRRE